MNYKGIFKSRRMRVSFMRLLSFLPDSFVVRIQYWIKTGRMLHLKSPVRFTEKLQWYKLYYRDPLMPKCADKYMVRQYVEEMGYGDILVPLYGVYDSIDSVDFDSLPNSFVVKDSLGCGGSSVLIIHNKNEIVKNSVINCVKSWPNTMRGKHPGREWVYDNGKSRIIIEQLIDSGRKTGGLVDYKFFCFYGKVSFLYVISDRDLGKGVSLGVFSRDYEFLPVTRMDEHPLLRSIPKPKNYAEMIECAEKLSSPFPHARIDLYNQNGKILFGEITFFDGSGYMCFDPVRFDYLVGKEFPLPQKRLK